MCMEPVGEGAIRVTTGRSDIELSAVEDAGAPLTTRIRRGPSPAAALSWLGGEIAAQRSRWTLWTPVALGLGSAAYFALPREPVGVIGVVALAGAVVLLAGAGRLGLRWRIALVLAACALAGFGLAKLRQMRVAAPVAPALTAPQWIEGWVLDIDSPGQGGQRLLIAPARIGDLPAEATPIRVRVTLRPGAYLPSPGAPVRLLAIVNPPPPASPGAYDFARDAYFESIGGVGFALAAPSSWTTQAAPPVRLRVMMSVNAARWGLTRRIVDTIGARTGGLAAAMTTGHEAFIPRQQVDDLRASGLAHIVSISGLHMAIVGGFVFALFRLAVAALPWLALRVPGKKIAAMAGLAAVGGYLILSGAPPPAERAAINATVAFLAILVDRQAISLHALALAAMGVLILQPEAVIEPGFQMSFAATAALVALAEAWTPPVREINTPWAFRLVQGVAAWTLVSLAASFVAGLATGPFAIQHFNRVATWGLPANLLVAPISSFLMMPALAVGAALTPLGLGRWPLEAAGAAIGMMNAIAQRAATAPHAQLTIASAPSWALVCAFVGIIWLCVWKGRLRWLGLPLALAVSWAPRPPAPDIWIASDGSTAAVRSGRDAILLRPDVKLFGAELWARRHGLQSRPNAGEYDCDAWSCMPTSGAPASFALTWNLKRPLKPGRQETLCDQAQVVAMRGREPPSGCGERLALGPKARAQGGAAELRRLQGDDWTIVWAQDLRGRRPWSWGPIA